MSGIIKLPAVSFLYMSKHNGTPRAATAAIAGNVKYEQICSVRAILLFKSSESPSFFAEAIRGSTIFISGPINIAGSVTSGIDMPIKIPSVSIACVWLIPEITSRLGINIVLIELIIVIITELAHIGTAIRDISGNILVKFFCVLIDISFST